MKQYDLERIILACILDDNKLINELYIDENVFSDETNKKLLKYFKKVYKRDGCLDINLMAQDFKDEYSANQMLNFYAELVDTYPDEKNFYKYQEQLVSQYRNNKIGIAIKQYESSNLNNDELVELINSIQNESLVVTKSNKDTPDKFLEIATSNEELLKFNKLIALNNKLKIKKKTVNVIGARPSEGKSALSLNLFLDLAKNYNCLYFNMEMTQQEVYQRMLGIESNIPISQILKPVSDYQEQQVKESANRIYNYNYEIINGSKTIASIKSKIISKQRDGHVIVFIDYIGYIVGKKGQDDKTRIGEAVRELNNITKDYDCTIFIVAQINRNGSDIPTMQDLKDSGELEQTADTIILIHDGNKNDTNDIKEIEFLIPKCRSGKRNVKIPIIYDKSKQIMSIKESRYE